MGYYSELAGDLEHVEDQLYKAQAQARSSLAQVAVMQKLLDKRDDHILWMRERLKDIAAMKNQPQARDVARQTLLDGMGGFEWKRPDH